MVQNQKKRVNITLPQKTLNTIDAVTKSGNRSRFINQAVTFYINKIGRKNLRTALKEGAQQRYKRNRDVATKWFNLEEEAWEKSGQ